MADLIDPRVSRTEYDDAETYGQVMGVLLDGVHNAISGTDPRKEWDTIPQSHQALLVLQWAIAEIYNGALDQYYFNSSGDTAGELPAAARFFGADRYAEVFAAGNDLFDAAMLHIRGHRQQRLPEIEDELDALTDDFYRLEDHDDEIIYAYVVRYIEAHPAEFFVDG